MYNAIVYMTALIEYVWDIYMFINNSSFLQGHCNLTTRTCSLILSISDQPNQDKNKTV